MTKSSDAHQNLIGGFHPHEGLEMLIGVGNVSPDGRLERLCAAMHPAPPLFLRQQGEPTFHQIEPGSAGWREVQMEARSLEQPPSNPGGLMRAGVVEDEMHVQLCRDCRLNHVEELPKFSGSLPLVQLPNHLARLHVQRRKQRGGAVTPIVMGAPLDLSGTHRQQRPRPIQRLNLRVLVHAQHQGFVRRIQVQPDDIPDLLDEERILGEVEGLGPMRLESEGAPDAADRALTEAVRCSHVSAAPVGRCRGGRLQRQRQKPLHLRIAGASRGAGARLIQQPVQPSPHKGSPPTPDVCPVVLSSVATVRLVLPVAQASTSRAQRARACAVLGRRAHCSRVCRSSAVTRSSVFGRPVCIGVLLCEVNLEDTMDAQLMLMTSDSGH